MSVQLKRLRLRNFKCFERAEIECSKFTLLTGANSSGKSSLIYSILGAVQTKNFPFYYSPNGSYANMGDFVEIAYNHRKTTPVGVLVELQQSNNSAPLILDGTFSFNRATNLPRLLSLNFDSPYLEFKLQRNSFFHGEYRYQAQQDPNAWRESEEFADVMRRLFAIANKTTPTRHGGKRKSAADRSTDQYLKDFVKSQKEQKFRFSGSADLFKSFATRPVLARRIREITEPVADFEKGFNYVSSFRLPPERTYYERTQAALKVESFGQNWMEQIVEWEQSKARQLEKLKDAARKLKLLKDFKSTRYAGGRYEIRVTPHEKCVDSSLVDVGFGISQFLPILVADAQLPKSSTLIVSQPEIHLHPSVEADFANYLVDSQRTDNKAIYHRDPQRIPLKSFSKSHCQGANR